MEKTQKTLLRLKKIIGQINGVIKMMENAEDCEKTIIQYQAIKSAVESAFSEFLHNNLEKCLLHKDQTKLEKIVKLISKN